MSRDDEHTGRYSDQTRTQVHSKKVSVKLVKGEVRGPYGFFEVLERIARGRFIGDEEIMLEGETKWRPISSELEFFDAFEARRKSRSQKKSVTGFAIRDENKKQAASASSKKIPRPNKKIKRNNSKEPSSKSTENNVDLRFEALGQDRAFRQTEPNKNSTPEFKGFLKLIGGLLLAGLVLWVGVDPNAQFWRSKNQDKQGAQKNLFQFRYFQPLGDLRWPALSTPMLPTSLVASNVESNEWIGFGFSQWMSLLSEHIRNPGDRLEDWKKAVFWSRHLGEGLWFSHPTEAKAALEWSLSIQSQLENSGSLSKCDTALYETVKYFHVGDWERVLEGLQPCAQHKTAVWYKNRALWMKFLYEGAATPPRPEESEYADSFFRSVAQLQNSMLARSAQDQHFLNMAQHFPESFFLWHFAGLSQWRFGGGDMALAYRFFTTGLALLNDAPLSFQVQAWDVYSGFLSVYGRSALGEKALSNAQILQHFSERALSSKSYAPSDLTGFWDFDDQDSFDFDRIVQINLAAIRSQGPRPAFLSSIEVLLPFVRGVDAELIQVGERLALDGLFYRARMFFSRLLEHKNDPRAHLRMVWIESELYHFETAQKHLASVGRHTQKDLYEGVLYFVAREYELASEKLEAYVKSVPEDPWGHLFYARMLFHVKDYAGCAKQFDIAKVHAQHDLKIYAESRGLRCRAFGHLMAGRALDLFRDLLEKNPQSWVVLESYVESLEHGRLVNRAIEVLNAAQKEFVTDDRLFVLKGQILNRAGRKAEALDSFREATRNPRPSKAWFHIGELLFESKAFLESALAFERAADIDPWRPESWLWTARAYRQSRGQQTQALRAYLRELEARPSVVPSFVEAAQFLLEIQAPHEVDKLFQRVSTDYQGDPRVLLVQAQAAWALKNCSKARNFASLALMTDSRLMDRHRIMGPSFHEESQTVLAKKHLQHYLGLGPGAADRHKVEQILSLPQYQD